MNRSSAMLVRLQITHADTAYILRKLIAFGISLFNIRNENDITVTISVKPSEYKETMMLLTKWGVAFSLLDKDTQHNTNRLFSRPMLKLAILFLFIISLYIPGRILFVYVSGNNVIPSRKIIEAAGSHGVHFGARAHDVRSEKVKNSLLEKIPELQWVGVNTNGCVATIQVEEKTANSENAEIDHHIVSIVASTNGIVKSCTATRGTMLCKVGQAVVEGETLISPYTDCGILIKTTKAEGEVYALTAHQISAVSPSFAVDRGKILKEEAHYSLKFGKKLINFNNSSGIYHGTCAKIYEEKYMVLPGGFVLPVSLVKETFLYFYPSTANVPLWSDEKYLTDHIDQLFSSRMVAGRIDKKYVHRKRTDELFVYDVRYICTEMISREKTEQVLQGEFYSD